MRVKIKQTYLRCVANRIKFHVVLGRFDGAELFHHRLLEELSNGPSFLLVHRGLVRQPDLIKHLIWIESLAHGLLEVLQEGFLVASVQDVVRDHFRLLHVLDADVVLAETDGRDSFLVPVLAVDDRRQTLLLVLVDRVPDLAHPRTRRVDNFNVLQRDERNWKRAGVNAKVS